MAKFRDKGTKQYIHEKWKTESVIDALILRNEVNSGNKMNSLFRKCLFTPLFLQTMT